jgi:DNA repair exonuclease SbcCD ATPase subunit
MPSDRPTRSPEQARRRLAVLAGRRALLATQLGRQQADLKAVREYLDIAGRVGQALELLSERLFEQLLGLIEDKLTIALQEVLDQPIKLRAKAEWKRNAASVEFWIERDGQAEDIMKGQGGSVANVLSIGLRMFALATLGEEQHRRFLVLDEQDCWLRPDLVPRLVKIVHDAGKALGFQVLMISHHDINAFSQYADRIYQITPAGDGSVRVEVWHNQPSQAVSPEFRVEWGTHGISGPDSIDYR